MHSLIEKNNRDFSLALIYEGQALYFKIVNFSKKRFWKRPWLIWSILDYNDLIHMVFSILKLDQQNLDINAKI